MKNWKRLLKILLLLGTLSLGFVACNQDAPSQASSENPEILGPSRPITTEEIDAASRNFGRDSIIPILLKEIAAKKALGKATDVPGTYRYFTWIHTADVENAGTGAKMYISFYGSNFNQENHYMNTTANDFERNDYRLYQRDDISGSIWEGWSDLGLINTIKIRHDNSGTKPGWLGDYATVYRCFYGDTACTYYGFNLNASGNEWLASGYPYSDGIGGYYRIFSRSTTGTVDRSAAQLP